MNFINFILIMIMLTVGVPIASSATVDHEFTLDTMTDKTNMTITMYDASGDSKYEIMEIQLEFEVLEVERIIVNPRISNSTHVLYNKNFGFDPSSTGRQLYNITLYGWDVRAFDTIGDLTIIMYVGTLFIQYPEIIEVIPFDFNDFVETPITWGDTKAELLDVIDEDSNSVPDGLYDIVKISKQMNVSVPGTVFFRPSVDGDNRQIKTYYDVGNYVLNTNFSLDSHVGIASSELVYSANIEIQSIISYADKALWVPYSTPIDSAHTLPIDGSELGSVLLEAGVSHQLLDEDGDGRTDGLDITITINSRLQGNITAAIWVKMKDTYIYPPIDHLIGDAFLPGETNYTMHVTLRDLQLELWSDVIAVGSYANIAMDHGVIERLDKYFDIIYDHNNVDDLGARFEKVDALPLGNPINAFNVSTTIEMLEAGNMSLTYEAELETGEGLMEWAFTSNQEFEPGFHTISDIFAVPSLVKSDGVFSLNITGRFTFTTGETFVFDEMSYKQNIIANYTPPTDPTDPTTDPTDPTSDPMSTTVQVTTNTSTTEPSTEQSTPTAPVPFWFNVFLLPIIAIINKKYS